MAAPRFMPARSEPFADYFHKAANVKFTENVCFKCFIIIFFFLFFFIMFCFLFSAVLLFLLLCVSSLWSCVFMVMLFKAQRPNARQQIKRSLNNANDEPKVRQSNAC